MCNSTNIQNTSKTRYRLWLMDEAVSDTVQRFFCSVSSTLQKKASSSHRAIEQWISVVSQSFHISQITQNIGKFSSYENVLSIFSYNIHCRNWIWKSAQDWSSTNMVSSTTFLLQTWKAFSRSLSKIYRRYTKDIPKIYQNLSRKQNDPSLCWGTHKPDSSPTSVQTRLRFHRYASASDWMKRTWGEYYQCSYTSHEAHKRTNDEANIGGGWGSVV